MKKFIKRMHEKIKTFTSDNDNGEGEEEYLELDTTLRGKDKSSKIIVRPFVIEDFSDIRQILETLREGYTIALVNIKPLKDKDLVELKRAINKLKKTCDAIDGDIAGFGDDYIIVTPNFAEIYRAEQTEELKEE
ncbi:cell division protein SepF [Candidatus Woesearchaeota archaeon]|nr:cell division protein SepF [Candidatus Woesearchaeota archaeon]